MPIVKVAATDPAVVELTKRLFDVLDQIDPLTALLAARNVMIAVGIFAIDQMAIDASTDVPAEQHAEQRASAEAFNQAMALQIVDELRQALMHHVPPHPRGRRGHGHGSGIVTIN
jgi:hypothetical protein